MNVFLVCPTNSSGDVLRKAALAAYGEDNVLELENGSFFVAVLDEHTPITKVKESVGIKGPDNDGYGVIIKMANYSGYATKSIGDWLEAKSF